MLLCSEIITFCAFFAPVLLHSVRKIAIIGYEVTPMQLEEILRSMCNDIELITGIKTVIYDENQKLMYEHPSTHCEFCKEIRKSEELTKKCLECDRRGFWGSALSKDIYIYRCHMGLCEAVAPVLENGRTVGFLMLGQLLPEGARDDVRGRISELSDSKVSKDALNTYLDAMSETDDQHLRAAARILAMSATYVRFHEWMRGRKETATYEIERYVFENLGSEGLNAQSVGVAMGLSRTSLYKLCIESFGIGMGEYIRKMRADEAVRLLQMTDLPLFRVAERVGLSTPVRLSRLLKAEIGMTAREIRKKKATVDI